MSKTRALLAVLAVLAVSGCSAVASDADVSTERSTPAPEESSAVTTEGDYGDYTQDEFYLASLGPAQREAAGDADLIAQGKAICERARGGESVGAMLEAAGVNMPGESLFESKIITYGVQVYCPEFTSS